MGDQVTSIFGRERLQHRQILAMIGQSDRHDGKRRNAGVEPQKVIDRAIEVYAVVKSGTQDNLAMHLNAGTCKALDLSHKPIVFVDTEQRSTQLRFSCMNRYIER